MNRTGAPVLWRCPVTFLSEHLAMPKLKLPTSVDRRLLSYFHSGEVMRHFLPKLIRISAVMGLIFYAISWLLIWPAVYEEFERWGLVKAFFAQMIVLATIFLSTKVSLIRAKHLETLPADDFVVLRAVAVLCRWYAEISLVYVLGMGLSSLIQPLSPILMSLFNVPPTVQEGSGTVLQSALSGGVSTFAVIIVAPLFLVLYSVATAIDLSLAIEFNTRAERVGREML